ncbi:MAG: TIGR02449 family protein [Parahaliea sp.]
MADNPLKALESKIDQLSALCQQLNQENRALKADASRWQQERQDLIHKNELARDKVATMIDRLRAMEQSP